MTATAPRRHAYERLLNVIRPLHRVVIAFSGGVDSTLLLRACLDALPAEEVLAVTLATPYTPRQELLRARELASALGAAHQVRTMAFPEVLRNNPSERCYLCKRFLFGQLVHNAATAGGAVVLDGTNADDIGDYRPGLRAVRELGIQSPLLLAKLRKTTVRRLSREHELPTWNLPAGACLLTRLPHDTNVTEAELSRVDAGEDFLRDIGFSAVRLRSHGELARIEVPRQQLAALMTAERKHGIDMALKTLGYRYVTVDLAGYRQGNLDETVAPGDKTQV